MSKTLLSDIDDTDFADFAGTPLKEEVLSALRETRLRNWQGDLPVAQADLAALGEPLGLDTANPEHLELLNSVLAATSLDARSGAVSEALAATRGEVDAADVLAAVEAFDSALSASVEGMENSYEFTLADGRKVNLDWDPVSTDLTVEVEHGDGRGSTVLHGAAPAEMSEDGEIRWGASQADPEPVTYLSEEFQDLVAGSVFGIWRQGDKTWIIRPPGDAPAKAQGVELSAEAKEASLLRERISELRAKEVHVWRSPDGGQVIQETYRDLRGLGDYEYLREESAHYFDDQIADLEGRLSEIEDAEGGPRAERDWFQAYDPLELAESRETLTPISMSTIEADGYRREWDTASFDGRRVVGQRRMREEREFNDELPGAVTRQLMQSWDPVEWVELTPRYNVRTRRIELPGENWNMHVTYNGMSMSVLDVHTPFFRPITLERRAGGTDESNETAVTLRLVGPDGKLAKVIEHDVHYRIEAEYLTAKDVPGAVQLTIDGDLKAAAATLAGEASPAKVPSVEIWMSSLEAADGRADRHIFRSSPFYLRSVQFGERVLEGGLYTDRRYLPESRLGMTHEQWERETEQSEMEISWALRGDWTVTHQESLGGDETFIGRAEISEDGSSARLALVGDDGFKRYESLEMRSQSDGDQISIRFSRTNVFRDREGGVAGLEPLLEGRIIDVPTTSQTAEFSLSDERLILPVSMEPAPEEVFRILLTKRDDGRYAGAFRTEFSLNGEPVSGRQTWAKSPEISGLVMLEDQLSHEYPARSSYPFRLPTAADMPRPGLDDPMHAAERARVEAGIRKAPFASRQRSILVYGQNLPVSYGDAVVIESGVDGITYEYKLPDEISPNLLEEFTAHAGERDADFTTLDHYDVLLLTATFDESVKPGVQSGVLNGIPFSWFLTFPDANARFYFTDTPPPRGNPTDVGFSGDIMFLEMELGADLPIRDDLVLRLGVLSGPGGASAAPPAFEALSGVVDVELHRVSEAEVGYSDDARELGRPLYRSAPIHVFDANDPTTRPPDDPRAILVPLAGSDGAGNVSDAAEVPTADDASNGTPEADPDTIDDPSPSENLAEAVPSKYTNAPEKVATLYAIWERGDLVRVARPAAIDIFNSPSDLEDADGQETTWTRALTRAQACSGDDAPRILTSNSEEYSRFIITELGSRSVPITLGDHAASLLVVDEYLINSQKMLDRFERFQTEIPREFIDDSIRLGPESDPFWTVNTVSYEDREIKIGELLKLEGLDGSQGEIRRAAARRILDAHVKIAARNYVADIRGAREAIVEAGDCDIVSLLVVSTRGTPEIVAAIMPRLVRSYSEGGRTWWGPDNAARASLRGLTQLRDATQALDAYAQLDKAFAAMVVAAAAGGFALAASQLGALSTAAYVTLAADAVDVAVFGTYGVYEYASKWDDVAVARGLSANLGKDVYEEALAGDPSAFWTVAGVALPGLGVLGSVSDLRHLEQLERGREIAQRLGELDSQAIRALDPKAHSAFMAYARSVNDLRNVVDAVGASGHAKRILRLDRLDLTDGDRAFLARYDAFTEARRLEIDEGFGVARRLDRLEAGEIAALSSAERKSLATFIEDVEVRLKALEGDAGEGRIALVSTREEALAVKFGQRMDEIEAEAQRLRRAMAERALEKARRGDVESGPHPEDADDGFRSGERSDETRPSPDPDENGSSHDTSHPSPTPEDTPDPHVPRDAHGEGPKANETPRAPPERNVQPRAPPDGSTRTAENQTAPPRDAESEVRRSGEGPEPGPSATRPDGRTSDGVDPETSTHTHVETAETRVETDTPLPRDSTSESPSPNTIDPEAPTNIERAPPETTASSGLGQGSRLPLVDEVGRARRDVVLGERIGTGATHQVFEIEGKPGLVARVAAADAYQYGKSYDDFGRRALQAIESPDVRIVKSEGRFFVNGGPNDGRIVELIERVPETAADQVARNADGTLTPGQAAALDRAVRRLNDDGLVWADNHHRNFVFEKKGEAADEWSVAIIDSGGIIKMIDDSPGSAIKRARRFQKDLGRPRPDRVEQIRQADEVSGAFSRKTREAVSQEIRLDMIKSHGVGFDFRGMLGDSHPDIGDFGQVPFRGDGTLNFPKYGALSQADDADAAAAIARRITENPMAAHNLPLERIDDVTEALRSRGYEALADLPRAEAEAVYRAARRVADKISASGADSLSADERTFMGLTNSLIEGAARADSSWRNSPQPEELPGRIALPSSSARKAIRDAFAEIDARAMEAEFRRTIAGLAENSEINSPELKRALDATAEDLAFRRSLAKWIQDAQEEVERVDVVRARRGLNGPHTGAQAERDLLARTTQRDLEWLSGRRSALALEEIEAAEALLQSNGLSWSGLLKDRSVGLGQMHQMLTHRRSVVDGILAEEIARFEARTGLKVEALAFGSNKLTSDYDLSLRIPDGEPGAAEIIRNFNARIRERFGGESGTVFDTNVYSEPAYSFVGAPRFPGGRGLEAGQADALRQRMYGEMAMRRYASDADWETHKARLLDGASEDEKIALEYVFGRVEVNHTAITQTIRTKQAEILGGASELRRIEGRVEELNELKRTGTLSPDQGDELGSLSATLEQSRLHAANETYVDVLASAEEFTAEFNRLSKVDLNSPDALKQLEESPPISRFSGGSGAPNAYGRNLEALRNDLREVTAARQSGLSPDAALVRAEARRAEMVAELAGQARNRQGQALYFASEAYQTDGAIAHVVGELQAGGRKVTLASLRDEPVPSRLTPDQYFDSLAENRANMLKEIEHLRSLDGEGFKDPVYAAAKASKYMIRQLDAAHQGGIDLASLPDHRLVEATVAVEENRGSLDAVVTALDELGLSPEEFVEMAVEGAARLSEASFRHSSFGRNSGALADYVRGTEEDIAQILRGAESNPIRLVAPRSPDVLARQAAVASILNQMEAPDLSRWNALTPGDRKRYADALSDARARRALAGQERLNAVEKTLIEQAEILARQADEELAIWRNTPPSRPVRDVQLEPGQGQAEVVGALESLQARIIEIETNSRLADTGTFAGMARMARFSEVASDLEIRREILSDLKTQIEVEAQAQAAVDAAKQRVSAVRSTGDSEDLVKAEEFLRSAQAALADRLAGNPPINYRDIEWLSGNRGALSEAEVAAAAETLTRNGNRWMDVANDPDVSPTDLNRMTVWRRFVLNQMLDDILSDLGPPGDRWPERLVFKSDEPNSDIDLIVRIESGQGSADVLRRFNELVRSEFGVETATVFNSRVDVRSDLGFLNSEDTPLRGRVTVNPEDSEHLRQAIYRETKIVRHAGAGAWARHREATLDGLSGAKRQAYEHLLNEAERNAEMARQRIAMTSGRVADENGEDLAVLERRRAQAVAEGNEAIASELEDRIKDYEQRAVTLAYLDLLDEIEASRGVLKALQHPELLLGNAGRIRALGGSGDGLASDEKAVLEADLENAASSIEMAIGLEATGGTANRTRAILARAEAETALDSAAARLARSLRNLQGEELYFASGCCQTNAN